MTSPLKHKFALLFLGLFALVPLLEAKRGVYVTLPDIYDKRLPYPIATYATKEQLVCRRFCIRVSKNDPLLTFLN